MYIIIISYALQLLAERKDHIFDRSGYRRCFKEGLFPQVVALRLTQQFPPGSTISTISNVENAGYKLESSVSVQYFPRWESSEMNNEESDTSQRLLLRIHLNTMISLQLRNMISSIHLMPHIRTVHFPQASVF